MAVSDNWIRVSKCAPCLICGKPDWCMRSRDGTVAICCRIASERHINAGWIHRLSESVGPTWRVARCVKAATTDYTSLAVRLERECVHIQSLAFELGVSSDSLKRLRLGWNAERRAYSFPMLRNDGSVCGISYRSLANGSKFCEPGSRMDYLLTLPHFINDA